MFFYGQMDVNMIETGKSNAVRWGNRLGYIILPFHLAMHDDPLEYVRKAKQVIDRKKNSLEVLAVHLSIDIVFKVFGPKVPFYLLIYACSSKNIKIMPKDFKKLQ